MSKATREPIKLLEQITVVVFCPECSSEIRVPMVSVMEGAELECLDCAQFRAGMKLSGDQAEAIERGFQRLQSRIREAGAWLEVRAYP